MENNDTPLPCTIGELEATLTTLAEGEFYYVDIFSDKNVLLTMSNVKDLLTYVRSLLLLWSNANPPLEVKLSSPGTNEKTILLVVTTRTYRASELHLSRFLDHFT